MLYSPHCLQKALPSAYFTPKSIRVKNTFPKSDLYPYVLDLLWHLLHCYRGGESDYDIKPYPPNNLYKTVKKLHMLAPLKKV